MAQPTKKKVNLTIVIGVLAVLIVAAATYAAIVFFPGSQTPNQLQDTFVPTLQSNLQCVDDRSNAHNPVLHVTGTIENIGNATAKTVTLNIYALQNNNVTAIDTSATLNNIEPGTQQTVDLTFAYTGEALTAYSEPTIEWTDRKSVV